MEQVRPRASAHRREERMPDSHPTPADRRSAVSTPASGPTLNKCRKLQLRLSRDRGANAEPSQNSARSARGPRSCSLVETQLLHSALALAMATPSRQVAILPQPDALSCSPLTPPTLKPLFKSMLPERTYIKQPACSYMSVTALCHSPTITKEMQPDFAPRFCKTCHKPLQVIGSARRNGKQTHGDWAKRTQHKKCWQKLQPRRAFIFKPKKRRPSGY